jgi:hypothetical protein
LKLKHYLIASEDNDYKPWVITPQALGLFCLVIWSLRFIVPASFTLAANTIDATDLMTRINEQRTQRFIPALTTNSKLISAASGKANDMIERSYFAHIDPDGKYVWPRIVATGYNPYSTLGENLAIDFTSASEVVNAWMNSPTHRANIVNEKFQDQGLSSLDGQYEANHDTIMIVSLFGTLIKSSTPPPPVAKATPTPAPTPKPTPTPAAPTTYPLPPTTSLSISKDVKISTTSLSGHTMVNVEVNITGGATLVTGQLNSQSITLIPGKVKDIFLGSFTFDPGEDLSDTKLTVEARNKDGVKATEYYAINLESQVVGSSTQQTDIPVSNEAQVIKVLRIIFGILAVLYMGFLIIDAIIIRQAKIKREGLNTHPHLLIFALLATITLFSNWF